MSDPTLRSLLERARDALERANSFIAHREGQGNIFAEDTVQPLVADIHFALTAPQPAKDQGGEVVITLNGNGDCVAVTRQDDEGQILSVVWQALNDEERAAHKARYEETRAALQEIRRQLRGNPNA